MEIVDSLDEVSRARRFEMMVVPHLAAGHKLARWLTRSDIDAEDVLQDATVRAFRFIEQCHGENPRGWFLTIVRNAAFSWLRRNRLPDLIVAVDENGQSMDLAALAADPDTPETIMLEDEARRRRQAAIEALPTAYHQMVILREHQGLSYKDIAKATGTPLGTVMSRLARARAALAAIAVCLLLILTLTLRAISPSVPPRLAGQVVDDHLRSLATANLTDFTSADSRGLKHWFAERLDGSPRVENFAQQGFTLLGGRLDRLEGRTVAAVVYRHQGHVINVFAFPGHQRGFSPVLATKAGYALASWACDGFTYWAVSDSDPTALDALGQLVIKVAAGDEPH